MSTELCINLNDELTHSYPNYSGLASMGYSSLKTKERELLNETLSGNVSKEYAFCEKYLKLSRYSIIQNQIGTKVDSAVEAMLDHSAMANVPEALSLAAYISYFGGISTPPSKDKAQLYIAESILQGNYETFGILHDLNRNVLNPLTAAYHLEQFFIPDSMNLYKVFNASFQEDKVEADRQFFSKLLIKAKSAVMLDEELYLKNWKKLTEDCATLFRLGCSEILDNFKRDSEESGKELLLFTKELVRIINLKEIFSSRTIKVTERELIHQLSAFLPDIKKEAAHVSGPLEALCRGLETVFTRIYLEFFSPVVIKKDSSTLKAAVDRVIAEFKNAEDKYYGESPYVARLIALYDIKDRHGDLYDKLTQSFTACSVPEFATIGDGLKLGDLVAASVAAKIRKGDGKGACCFEQGKFSFNTKALSSYISTTYRTLCHQFCEISEYISSHTRQKSFKTDKSTDAFYKDCVQFISTCIDLDPVLAYNSYRYSRSIGKLIRYLVDKADLPPSTIARIEKEAPYYGYTGTTGANLYLGCETEGKASKFFSEKNKAEQEISRLRQLIVEGLFGSIVGYFEILKDNPSQNFDYLLKEYLCAVLCSLDLAAEKPNVLKRYAPGIYTLLDTLYHRAEQQLAMGSSGIAAECLADFLKMKFMRELIKQIGSCLKDTECRWKISNDILAFQYNSAPKYPVSTGSVYLAGDTRACDIIREIVDSNYSRWHSLLTADFGLTRLKTVIHGCLYYKSLLAYDLCCPISIIRDRIKNYEEAFLENQKGYSSLSALAGKYKSAEPEVHSEKKVKTSLHIPGNHRLGQELNEKIVPLLRADPQKLRKYGFKMMPNFILYGESGTGKTRAVKAFCDHLGLTVVEINSATIGDSCIHETPKKIHSVFAEAFKKKNAVIVIDEADAFLAERSNLKDNYEYKLEEVNAFLQCIDKAVENHTLVVCITNYLDKIDSAILRSGRLGLHIEVKNPDEQDIKEVIRICFDNLEHEKLNLDELSKALLGQNLANIFSILNEVKIDALMADKIITQSMIMDKINRTQGYTLKAGARFELPGQKEFENYVNENIVDHLSNPEYYRRFNLRFPNSILLYGPTGTGKTFCAKRLSEFLGWKFYELDSKNIGSETVKGSAIKIAEVFKKARNEAPCIIFIDEIDAWLPKRDKNISSSDLSSVNEFLSNMSRLDSDNLLLIGTTNRLDDIDEAALRNGRFSARIEIGYMKSEQVKDLLYALLKDIPYDENLDVSEIAGKLDNKSAADVVACFEKACRYGATKKYDRLTSECFQKTMAPSLQKDHKVQRMGFI